MHVLDLCLPTFSLWGVDDVADSLVNSNILKSDRGTPVA